MVMHSIYVIGGLVLLVVGAEALVRGATWVAIRFNISPGIIGLTIIAAGTSLPELMVSLFAALNGDYGISVGNIVGSNIFNLAAILGLTALILPLKIENRTLKLDAPIMVLSGALLTIMCLDGKINRYEGIILSTLLALAITILWEYDKKNKVEKTDTKMTTASFGFTGVAEVLMNSGAIIVGIVFLALGSKILVIGAKEIAIYLKVSETIIGLTLVAAGTSLPELITSMVAAKRGQDDIAVANVVGSNIFNIFGIIGITAIINPLMVPTEIIIRDNAWLLGISIITLPIIISGKKITRSEGIIYCVIYLIYSVVVSN